MFPSSLGFEEYRLLMQKIKELNPSRLCLLGGEPTLHPNFHEIILVAQEYNFDELIIDSNGLKTSLDKLLQFKHSDFSYIQISIDGASSETHDYIRGNGTYKQVINSIKKLSDKGFNLKLICTVNKINHKDCLNLIPFADKLGIEVLKFHVFSPIGVGREHTDLAFSPSEWIQFTNKLLDLEGKYKIKIQFQPAYANKYLGEKYCSQGYQGCIGRKINRVSIFPNGKSYVCSFLFDTELNFANLSSAGLLIKKEYSEYNLFQEKEKKCSICDYLKICKSGCPAENLISNFLPCSNYPEIFPICRLWKYTL
jgi:radical SAM protein with 4Fe4S-binding SPASM domain